MYIYPGKYVPQTLHYQFVELVKSLKYFSLTHPTPLQCEGKSWERRGSGMRNRSTSISKATQQMIQSILMAILFFFMFSVLSKLVTMLNVPQQQLLSPIFQHTCFHLRKTKCLPHETLTKISTFQYRKFNSNCDTIENEMQQIKRYSTLITIATD